MELDYVEEPPPQAETTETPRLRIGVTPEGHAMIRRRDELEVKKLARDAITNKVFVTNTMGGVSMSFGQLMIEMLPEIESYGFTVEEYYGDVGAYFEYVERSVGVVEGIPVFQSVQFLHRADVPLFLDYIDRMNAALDAI
ncbi:MAG TPA: hypothetical protein VJ742_13055 [Nitrososphaera sp.]|nr:hypothetical protein [Nitrososphaera sp.]